MRPVKFELQAYISYCLIAPHQATASALSHLTFSWMDKLIFQGNKKPLENEDLPELLPNIRARYSWKEFKITKPALALGRRILVFILPDVAKFSFLVTIQVFLDFVTPYLLQKLLQYFQNSDTIPVSQAYGYVALMLISQIGTTLFRSQVFYITRHIDVHLRAALNAEIYAKSLRMRDTSGMVGKKTAERESQAAEGENKAAEGESKSDSPEKAQPASTGKIVNLMSVDTNRVANSPNFAHIFISAPLAMVIGIVMLYRLLGWSALLGIGVMVHVYSIDFMIAGRHDATESCCDPLIQEFFQFIRIIKFASWEKMFAKRVLKSREFELQKLFISASDSFILLFSHYFTAETVSKNLLYPISIAYLTTISFDFLWYGAPILITIIAFFAFTVLQHGELDAPTAFTAILLFDRLQFPMTAFPQVIVLTVSGTVSLNRIADFLNEGEIDIQAQTHTERGPGGEPLIGFEDVSAQWFVDANKNDAEGVDATRFALRDINVKFPLDELSIICGPTGAGKSSLLSALLGEMDIISGKVLLPRLPVGAKKIVDVRTGLIMDSVAYVSQTAWLQNASIRDNILFGSPMEQDRYEKVLEACALKRDLEIFDDGDMTEIGEKGITLSGGQKQRVNLARAVYSRARHVLLDDCLSAVDAHTAKWIYDKCIMSNLMKVTHLLFMPHTGRTRILVTHHVGLCLPGAKYLVKIDGGRLTVKGEISDLKARGELKEVLEDGDIDSIDHGSSSSETLIEDVVENVLDEAGSSSSDSTKPANEPTSVATKTTSTPRKLVQDEKKEEGHVKYKIYTMYFFAAGGFAFWVSVLGTFLLTQLLNIAETNWLRYWSNAYGEGETTIGNITATPFNTFTTAPDYLGKTNDYTIFSQMPAHRIQAVFGALSTAALGGNDVNVTYYLGIYATLALIGVFTHCLQSLFILTGTVKAARSFYEQLLNAVMRAPVRFFDTTPVGRIMSRFSKDFEAIDSSLAMVCSAFIDTLLSLIAIIVVISLVTPAFLVAAAIIGTIFLLMGKLYVTCSRDLKRLDSNAKSPIYSQFGERFDDNSSLRGANPLHERDPGQDRWWNSSLLVPVEREPMALYVSCRRFQHTRLLLTHVLSESLSFPHAAAPTLLALSSLSLLECSFFSTKATLTPVSPDSLCHMRFDLWTCSTGFSAYSLNSLQRQYTQVEMDLNAIERVNEFLIMPREQVVGSVKPPAAWPEAGKIEAKDLVVQYAPELERVIHGISLTINPQEKVGVVGRSSDLNESPLERSTGSGKSTFATSLFRFVDPTEGSISIDGIDITSLGVDDLRSRLTIIPQDPVLFSGTIRFNLDPFEEHEDSELWDSLRRVHLVDSRPASPDQASDAEPAAEHPPGNHVPFASLDAQIIVMDEATASVDFTTDQKIQTTIRQEFASSTLVCIAHRLRTVIDYDRILVLGELSLLFCTFNPFFINRHPLNLIFILHPLFVDHGKIAEFDTPYALLFGPESKTSVFREMCEKSGEMEMLAELATKQHLNKSGL
ncbi:P-loop containing nucleoside triphosphate hydrolase protein [Jimgerdemannia flammicorona]|uniref:P-loop containing nucleoside triphosphate hydrolase protein n=1 Tax=Jimgerdemannia flammicorona TaxID=994334 RepID=A0A433DLD6_9FUNG|nr:P-loop containing nucleoside triphosphate hydrolase protein [Jimgerdemannia flammicorona]